MVTRSLVVQLSPQAAWAACVGVLRADQRHDLLGRNVVHFEVVDLLRRNFVHFKVVDCDADHRRTDPSVGSCRVCLGRSQLRAVSEH